MVTSDRMELILGLYKPDMTEKEKNKIISASFEQLQHWTKLLAEKTKEVEHQGVENS